MAQKKAFGAKLQWCKMAYGAIMADGAKKVMAQNAYGAQWLMAQNGL